MTTTELYDWDVQLCRLQFRPSLHGCYSLLDAFEQLRRDYHDWFVGFGVRCVSLSRTPESEPLLVLVEKGGVL